MRKLQIKFTGICFQDPLQHPDELELVDAILRDGKELNKFLPVLFSLGVDCILPRCSDTELNDLEDVLKKPRDRREGQVIIGYDRLFTALKDICERLSLRTPPLLKSETIDRMSLTYFNTNREVFSHYSGILYAEVCFAFYFLISCLLQFNICNFSGKEQN